VGSKNDIDTF